MTERKGENHMEDIRLEQMLPSEIEARSFELIEEELRRMGKRLDPENALVIKRAIHTTADFDYADSLVFSPGAVRRGVSALKKGAAVIMDTNMGLAGVNKRKLEHLGGEALCFMADEDVASAAAAKSVTRAAASMEKAARLYGCEIEGIRPCVIAVGNAPTALHRLYKLINQNRITPALVIGVPVGFVNVVQSKELFMTLKQIPFIVARGRKGGSNVAAAIVNALLYQI